MITESQFSFTTNGKVFLFQSNIHETVLRYERSVIESMIFVSVFTGVVSDLKERISKEVVNLLKDRVFLFTTD